MQPLIEPNQVVLEFWTRKAYNPAPHPEVRSFFFTPQEEADHPDTVMLLDHFLELLKRDGYLDYSSHEYTWPDGSPMKLFSLTPLGVELGKQLETI
jgi:hypothetical protein